MVVGDLLVVDNFLVQDQEQVELAVEVELELE